MSEPAMKASVWNQEHKSLSQAQNCIHYNIHFNINSVFRSNF